MFVKLYSDHIRDGDIMYILKATLDLQEPLQLALGWPQNFFGWWGDNIIDFRACLEGKKHKKSPKGAQINEGETPKWDIVKKNEVTKKRSHFV